MHTPLTYIYICRYPPRINEALYNDDAGLIALRPLEIGTALEDEEEVIPSGIVAPNTVASIDDVTTAISHDKNKGNNIVDNAAVTMKTIIELDSKMEDIINNEREVMKKEKNQLLLQEEDQQEQSDEGEKDVEEEEEEEEVPTLFLKYICSSEPFSCVVCLCSFHAIIPPLPTLVG